MHSLQKSGTRIFRLFGIDVNLHFSWWFIFILLAWSLSTAYFPQMYPGQTVGMYWLMGIIASLFLFASVILHELSHSLVARAKNIKVESITLFFFGGVAGIEREDLKPSHEFQMAVAGPLFSLVLSGIFFVFFRILSGGAVHVILQYLYELNFILALFNLVPAFPLDGGRAFRAILYAYYHDILKATRIASAGGKVFAVVLIVLGIIGMTSGLGNGLWFILLGIFLYFIAKVSYEQIVVKETLSIISVSSMMQTQKPLPASMALKDFLKKYGNSDRDAYLVEGIHFQGLLDLTHVSSVHPSLRKVSTLQQVAVPLTEIKSVHKADSAYTVFRRCTEQNVDALPVVDRGKIIGLVFQRAVLRRLAWLNTQKGTKKNK